jgi:hypothetical protein
MDESTVLVLDRKLIIDPADQGGWPSWPALTADPGQASSASTGRRWNRDIAGYLLGRSPGLLRACILVIRRSLTDWPCRLASG